MHTRQPMKNQRVELESLEILLLEETCPARKNLTATNCLSTWRSSNARKKPVHSGGVASDKRVEELLRGRIPLSGIPLRGFYLSMVAVVSGDYTLVCCHACSRKDAWLPAVLFHRRYIRVGPRGNARIKRAFVIAGRRGAWLASARIAAGPLINSSGYRRPLATRLSLSFFLASPAWFHHLLAQEEEKRFNKLVRGTSFARRNRVLFSYPFGSPGV